MYRVFWSKGRGTHSGPRFRYYQDALRYVREHIGERSYAIQVPSGNIVFKAERKGCLQS